MAPGGTLIQIEAERSPSFDFVFGALPGAWAFEDDLRTDSCLLPAERWRVALEGAGFGPVEFVTDATDNSPATGSLLVARAPLDVPAIPQQPAAASSVEGGSALVFDLALETGFGKRLTSSFLDAGHTAIRIAIRPDGGGEAPTEPGSIGYRDTAALSTLVAGMAAAPPAEIVVVAPIADLDADPAP